MVIIIIKDKSTKQKGDLQIVFLYYEINTVLRKYSKFWREMFLAMSKRFLDLNIFAFCPDYKVLTKEYS